MADTDDSEVEEYEPEPIAIGDGEVLIADPVELFEMTGSLAVMVSEGVLFVLKRDTMKWVNVESALKADRSTVVQAVRTKQ